MPLKYRLLLLGLLPCIAAVLYIKGQSYDPALIDFKTAPEGAIPVSPAAANSPQPSGKVLSAPAGKDIAGFRPMGEGRRYTKDNLYEHVDGHAEYFIGAGFAGLTVTGYSTEGSGAAQPEIEVEVYDMGKGIQAFGVLVDESGENPQAVQVGTMGFRTSAGLNFMKGRYYVKVTVYKPKSPVLKFARAFSDTLPPAQDSFKGFSRFPDLGKVEKTRFVKEGYRGLDFLRNVIEREYSAGSGKITVALMADGPQQVKPLLASFMEYFRKSGMRYERVGGEGLEAYKVMDKYEGNWLLVSAGDAVFGVFGTEDEEILGHLAKGKR
ncbi:MAG TPA: DUF6599 family protein [Dissulfurispiraceae bacterium]